MISRNILTFGLLLCTPWLLAAQETQEPIDSVDEILAGHSYHGDAFNEGPRQRAYLLGGTGNVNFPVTTKSEEAQAFINQGVGQLHGFWDLEAERSFRQAAAIDSNCAMSYWGAALATVRNRERARGFVDKALELRDDVTRREQMYIDALDKYLKEEPEDKSKRAANYLKDLESIVIEFPDDLEAKALVALRIWQNAREGIQISSYLAAEALLQEVFEAEPLHPAHHFSIHLWDYRKPERALKSAARCGPSAPSIAHMWHMPGHIYSRLKRYEDAVYQQEASARVDHAHMMRDRVMPDEIHNFAHNNEWLIRNLVYIGRVHDAVGLAKNMIELPQHPKYNTLKKRNGSASYGRRRLLQVLREYQLYEEAIQLCQSRFLEPTDLPEEQVKRLRLLGCSAAMTGRDDLRKQCVADLNQILTSQQAATDAEKSSDDKEGSEKEGSEKEGSEKEASDKADADDDKQAKDGSDAKPSLQEEEDKNRRSRRGRSTAKRLKGQIEKALLAIEGYQLVARQDYKQAYDKLDEAKGEDVSWLGELQFLAGKKEEGLKKVRGQVKRRPQEVIPLARLAYLVHKMEELFESRELFEQLRQTSSSMDLDVPLFARLSDAATEFGFKGSWLKPYGRAIDVGFRPGLKSLGPIGWSPSMAPQWNLSDANGLTYSSEEFIGRPHLIIFYLGHGCLHCAEQLGAFGPRYEDFKKAGIEMIAISTDGDEGLKLSLANYDGEMPVPLVANQSNSVFRKFRAFDDFENLPLHGTFLIDASGRIRWQDISYEPFMDHQFVLDEAQRLLSQGFSEGQGQQHVSRQ